MWEELIDKGIAKYSYQYNGVVPLSNVQEDNTSEGWDEQEENNMMLSTHNIQGSHQKYFEERHTNRNGSFAIYIVVCRYSIIIIHSTYVLHNSVRLSSCNC